MHELCQEENLVRDALDALDAGDFCGFQELLVVLQNLEQSRCVRFLLEKARATPGYYAQPLVTAGSAANI